MTNQLVQLYALMLGAGAGQLQQSASAEAWLRALEVGVDVIRRLGRAQPGHRTMVTPD